VRQLRLFGLFILAAVLLSTTSFSVAGVTSLIPQHGSSFQEYEKFHDVLHPLEHEALPKKDFKRIRAQANVLAKRGNAIIKLGVPNGTSDDKKEDFARELKSFREALGKFKADARRGTDDQVQTSFSAVHDTFETLAGMLPRK
jgi:hypothetical protein